MALVSLHLILNEKNKDPLPFIFGYANRCHEILAKWNETIAQYQKRKRQDNGCLEKKCSTEILEICMKYGSILVVTYGRSGSTLLQGILNSIDGCVVRGENMNLCFHFFLAYQSIKESKKMVNIQKKIGAQNAWYGAELLDEELYLSHIKNLVRKLLLAGEEQQAVKCYGFKEVRYLEHMKEFTEYLNFLEMIFPSPAIIFNTRRMDDVLKSGWWKRLDKDASSCKIEKLESLFKEYQKSHSNSFGVTYDDIVNETQLLRGLFEFLGAEYRPEDIRRVLSMPHSSDPAQLRIKMLEADSQK